MTDFSFRDPKICPIEKAMLRSLSFLFLLCLTFIAMACGSAADTNSNRSGDSNRQSNLDPGNLPPGLSPQPIQPSGNSTPGIPPANAINAVPKGATPTPGIPDPANINKPLKPGATPTPGIPDAETLRRQMNQVRPNANVPPPPANTRPNERKMPGPVNRP